MPAQSHPEVAIIGRPNVGKSTLFNRIVGRRQAIVGKQSGLTRDRHRADASWRGRDFTVTDTGGLEWDSRDEILAQIQEQALVAARGAAVVLFVVDGREGPAPVEAELAALLHRNDVPVILVVNKCDSERQGLEAAALFAELGIHPAFPVSAEHGVGVGDLLDAVVERLPAAKEEEAPGDVPVRIAVVGRPNVGKSSLVNALLGDRRLVVSDVPGTTRDAIDSLLVHEGREYLLIDTAGIRRVTRRDGFAENVSVLIARRRMQEADVALLVVDAVVGLGRQDVAIAAEAEQAGCGLVMVVNKWDLIEGVDRPRTAWVQELHDRMGRVGFAEFAFASAHTGEGVVDLLGLVDAVQQRRTSRVPTSELNEMFERLKRHGPQPPPGSPTLRYVTQVSVAPPTFVVFVGGPRREIPESYLRFLENRIRDAFDLSGTPVVIKVRRGGRKALEE